LSLLIYPFLVRISSSPGNVDLSCFDIDKEQRKEYFWSQRSKNLLSEEITRPQGLKMSPDRTIPRVLSSPGSRIYVIFKIFFTVVFDKRLIPSLFSSPKILPYPQLFSLASFTTNLRISSRVLGLPRLLITSVFCFRLYPLAHRKKVS
jgi:hypothetical protein